MFRKPLVPPIHAGSRFALSLTSGLALTLLLGGCNLGQRLSEVGESPKMASIENPTTQRGYQPVSMPMPAPDAGVRTANSLWRPGARAFFKDQRAARVGDILTVVVNIQETATLNNNTSRSRTTTETVGLTNFFGTETPTGTGTTNGPAYGSTLEGIFNGVNPGSMVNGTSAGSYKGTGKTDRSETVTTSIAATVTQVLPNGNLVIQGKQEVRVNFEVRELVISGIVRPEDITAQNTIAHSKIAEARLAYGGRGQLTDVQQPRYGTQLFDIFFPF